MKVLGNPVGSNKARPDYNENNPDSAAFIKNKPPRIVIGNTVPEGPAIWFNTAPGSDASAASLVLDEAEEQHMVRTMIDGETYGVKNATVNNANPVAQYNFTVL